MDQTPPRYQGRNADRQVEDWETVTVTALPPGWRNQYKQDDGSIEANDSPALLLQELRMITYAWDADPPRLVHTEDRHERAPYRTRVVFANHDNGELDAAPEISNYVGTVGPGETTEGETAPA